MADKLKKRDLTFPANTPELTKLLADTLRDNLKIPVNTGITINYIYRKAEQAGREELDEFRAMFKLLNNFVNSPPAIQKYLDENNTGVIISKGINGVEGSIQTILDSGCIDLNNVAKSVKDKLSNSNKEADSPIYLKLKFLAGNVSLILEILINRIKSNEKIDKNTNFNYPNKFIKEWNSLKEKYDKSIQNAPVKIDNLYIGVDNIKKALTNFVNFFGENGINIKMYQKLNECVPIFNNIFEFKKIKDLSKLNELQNFINENKQAINELEFIAGSAEIIEKAEDSDDKEYLDTNIKNDMSNFTKVYNKFIKANKEVGDVVTELVESINKVREKGKVESTNALVDLSTLLKHLIEGFDKLANIGSLIGLNLKRVSDNHNKKIEKYFLKYGNVGNYDNLKNAAYDNSAKIKNIGRERVPRLIRDEKRKLLPVLKDAKNFESKMKTMKIIEYLKTKVKKDLEDCKSEFESVNEEVDEK